MTRPAMHGSPVPLKPTMPEWPSPEDYAKAQEIYERHAEADRKGASPRWLAIMDTPQWRQGSIERLAMRQRDYRYYSSPEYAAYYKAVTEAEAADAEARREKGRGQAQARTARKFAADVLAVEAGMDPADLKAAEARAKRERQARRYRAQRQAEISAARAQTAQRNAAMIADRLAGMSTQELAGKYNVARSTASAITSAAKRAYLA